ASRRRGSSPPPRPPARTGRSRRTAARSTALDAVDGPAGGLPRVVRGAGAERLLVPDDARVPADVLRPLRVPEQVRVVALLQDDVLARAREATRTAPRRARRLEPRPELDGG